MFWLKHHHLYISRIIKVTFDCWHNLVSLDDSILLFVLSLPVRAMISLFFGLCQARDKSKVTDFTPHIYIHNAISLRDLDSEQFNHLTQLPGLFLSCYSPLGVYELVVNLSFLILTCKFVFGVWILFWMATIVASEQWELSMFHSKRWHRHLAHTALQSIWCLLCPHCFTCFRCHFCQRFRSHCV